MSITKHTYGKISCKVVIYISFTIFGFSSDIVQIRTFEFSFIIIFQTMVNLLEYTSSYTYIFHLVLKIDSVPLVLSYANLFNLLNCSVCNSYPIVSMIFRYSHRRNNKSKNDALCLNTDYILSVIVLTVTILGNQKMTVETIRIDVRINIIIYNII